MGCRAFPFALPGSAGSQSATSSLKCFARRGTRVQQGQRPTAPVGLRGHAAKHSGSAMGAGGWQDFLRAFEMGKQLQFLVSRKSLNLGWKCWFKAVVLSQGDIQVPAKSDRDLGYQTESALGGWGVMTRDFGYWPCLPLQSHRPLYILSCILSVVVSPVFMPALI